jgi:hypothetical protein
LVLPGSPGIVSFDEIIGWSIGSPTAEAQMTFIVPDDGIYPQEIALTIVD